MARTKENATGKKNGQSVRTIPSNNSNTPKLLLLGMVGVVVAVAMSSSQSGAAAPNYLTASVLDAGNHLYSSENSTTFEDTLSFIRARYPVITRIENTPAKDWDMVHYNKDDWESDTQFLDRGTLVSATKSFHLETAGFEAPPLDKVAWNPVFFAQEPVEDITTAKEFVPECWDQNKRVCYTSGIVRDDFLHREQWNEFVVPRVDENGDRLSVDEHLPDEKLSHMTYILSTSGAIQHLHADESHNFVFQTIGYKRFIMFPPDMCIKHFFLAPHGHHMRGYSLVENAEQMPMYQNINEAMATDIARFGVNVHLTPGDMLYVPPQWCHYVISDTDSVTLQIWSGSSDHQVGGTSIITDSIRHYLNQGIELPYKLEKLDVEQRAHALALLICYVGGKLQGNGESATAISELYDRKYRMIAKTLEPNSIHTFGESFTFEPCCISPSDDIVVEIEMDAFSSRVARMIQHAFQNLQTELFYRYIEDQLYDAFGNIATVTEFFGLFDQQCGGSEPDAQHLVFAVES